MIYGSYNRKLKFNWEVEFQVNIYGRKAKSVVEFESENFEFPPYGLYPGCILIYWGYQFLLTAFC